MKGRNVVSLACCLLPLCASMTPVIAQGTQGKVASPPAATSAPATAKKPAEATATPGKTEAGSPPAKDKASAPKTAAPVIVTLRKEVPGDFSYQFASRATEPTAPMPLPSPAANDATIALTLPEDFKPTETTLQILDTKRGDIARLPVKTGAVMELKESDFRYVSLVRVPVMKGGSGVVGAQVSLTTEAKSRQSVVLQTADAGVATFRDVPLGEPITVTVRYGAHPPKSQTETITRDHPADGYRWQNIEVDWTDAQTVALPASTSPSASGAASAGTESRSAPLASQPLPPPASPLSSLLNTVLGLLFFGGIIYGIYRAYTGGHIKPFLDKLGIQTAPITSTGTTLPDPFAKPERTPIQPITEGTADPIAGGVTNAAAGYAVVNTGPRLVGMMGAYAGNIFPLNTPSMDIGRDNGNAIPLPQDTNASRRHATIQGGNGQYTVTDNGSSNGTFVNGVRITAQTPQPLHPGDEVQIGQTRFRFEA